jgi:hypothetical protein
MVFGGTTMSGLTFGTTVLPDTAAFFRFWAIGRVICLSTGIAGAWQSSMFAQINQFAANIASGNDNTTTGFSCESTGSTVKDTTVDNQVSVSCAWGGTGGGPTITGQTVSFGRVR